MSENALAIVVVPYISPRVASIFREHQVGYLDRAGNCHLAAQGLYLHVEGRPNTTPDTRPAENLFAPKSSRVVRVLVEHSEREWGVQELSREARVSIGLVSRVKQKLVEEAFAVEDSAGVRVRDPAALLEAWGRAYVNRARTVSVYGMYEIREVEERIVRWGLKHSVRCALAEFSAANRLAPMVRYKRAVVYVEDSPKHDVVASMLSALRLKEVDSGATAVLWVTNDDAVFYNSIDREKLLTVSSVQTYLDLRKSPGRGPEAADEILQRRLLPRFLSSKANAP